MIDQRRPSAKAKPADPKPEDPLIPGTSHSETIRLYHFLIMTDSLAGRPPTERLLPPSRHLHSPHRPDPHLARRTGREPDVNDHRVAAESDEAQEYRESLLVFWDNDFSWRL
jgi:hypothetical protein